MTNPLLQCLSCKGWWVLLLTLVFTGNLQSQVYIPKERISAFDVNNGGGVDWFGFSAAMDGEWLVVGANKEDHDANSQDFKTNAGAIYFYKKNANFNWNAHGKVVPNNRDFDDQFGYSVDINENTVVVGAPFHEYDQLWESQTGAAYIFEKDLNDNWSQVYFSAPPNTFENDNIHFGFSVTVWGDYVAVGCPYYDLNEFGGDPLNGAGGVFIYKKNQLGTWEHHQTLDASNRYIGDEFGHSLSMWGDHLVVGAPGKNIGSQLDAGTIYIFGLDNQGNWVEDTALAPILVATQAEFGSHVDIENGRVVANTDLEQSTGVFELDMVTNEWNYIQSLSTNLVNFPNFSNGRVVIEGDRIFVGAPREDSYSGAVYLFEIDQNGQWMDIDRFYPADRPWGDFFGTSIAAYDNELVVATPWAPVENSGSGERGAAWFYRDCMDTDSLLIVVTDSLTYSSPSGKHTYSQSGNYSDTLVNSTGCDSLITINLTLLSDTGNTGLEIPESRNLLSVFPNPFENQISIHLGGTRVMKEVTIYDLTGRVVLSQSINVASQRFDLGQLPGGVYLFEVKFGGQFQRSMAIKKN